MFKPLFFCTSLALISIASSWCLAGPTHTDPEKAAKADADFLIQGEYSGTYKNKEGQEEKIGVQVIALGKGKFQAVGYHGGLPGDGWNKENKHTAAGELKDGTLTFKTDKGMGVLKDGTIEILTPDGKPVTKLKRVERKSPTLGAKPPMGAVVLYNGPEDAKNFKGGKADEDGHLQQGVTSKQTFGSHKLHIEFRIPYQPEDRGQGRGNSGLYLQGRYEVQMLDSFGLEGKDNECGGIYSVKAPDLNMALPPLQWQTYDVDYTAAKYGDDGKVASPPRITVRHNGVVIHDKVELPANRNTTAAPVKPGPEPGPVYLQNHGNPLRYRNIWVLETK